jgi:hypothetical protein
MVRLFINSFDAKHLWSTDAGPDTEESLWDSVVIAGPPAKTKVDLSKRGSKIEPCCRIEAECGAIRQLPIPGRHAVIEWS